jgi:pyruvate dehydrogenase E1 component alpha subunit
MPGVRVDGNDPVAVHNALSTAVARARAGAGPSLVECLTFRFEGHHFGDHQRYMPAERMRQARAEDPIPRFERFLAERAVAGADDLARLDGASVAAVDEALAAVLASPPPGADEIDIDVYADREGAPR